MKPLEAWQVVSNLFDELYRMRKDLCPQVRGYSLMETKAQVMCFEALRRMEEDEN